MRLSRCVVFFSLLVYFFPFYMANAQDDKAPAKAEKPSPPKTVTILLGRPMDATLKNNSVWMAPLIEAALEFKFAAINNIKMIDPSDVMREVAGHRDLLLQPDEADYLRTAKKIGVTYFVNQKYELARNNEIIYYAEIISVQTGKLHSFVEKKFKLNTFGSGIDDLVGLYMQEFNINPPKELTRFLRMPVVGTSTKSITALGEAITEERYKAEVNLIALSDVYREICEKDQSLLLGYYRAGLVFEMAGKFLEATQALNFLFMTAPEYTPVYLPLARSFRKAKRYQDAERIAQLGQKRGVTSSELGAELAMANTAMGKKDAAESAFKSILQNNPDDQFALLYNARKLNNEGKAAEALKLADRLLATNSERGQAQLERGRSLTKLGRNDEAIAALKEATQLLPLEVNPIMYLGDLYIATKQYSKAVEQYEKVLKKVPDNVDLYIKAADAAKKAGDSKKALALLYSIESRISNDGNLQKEIGLLEIASGDSSKARVHLEAAARSGADDEKVLTELGWLYLARNDYDNALKYMSKVLPVTKSKDEVRAGLVSIYLKKGDLPMAMTTLKSMQSKQNSIPNLYRMLGDAFIEKKQIDTALIYYRKEFAANPKDTALKSFIADLSYRTEPALNAKNEYNQVVKMGAGGPLALYRLTILYLRLKSPKSAKLYLEKAKKAGSADKQIWYEIGVEFANLGITSSAMDAFEMCLKEDASMKEAWVEMAKVLLRLKKDSAAAEAYMKLYEISRPKENEYLLKAAQLFDKSGASVKALEIYSMADNKDGISTAGKVRLAELEFEKGNFKEVLSHLEELSGADINIKEAKLLYESYFALGKFEKALPHIEFVRKKLPKDIRALELAARVNDTLNNSQDAVKLYEQYVARIGKHGDYAFRIGVLYETLDQKTSAIKQYSKNIKIYPKEYRNYDRLARLYNETGKLTQAIPILKKAISFEEAEADLNGFLAKALALSGGGTEAVAQFQTYLETNKDDYASWVQLGNLQYSKKKYSEAVEAFEQAVSLNKNEQAILVKLGDAYLKIEKTDKAIDVLSRAKKLKKDDTKVLLMLADCYRAVNDNKKLIEILEELTTYDNKAFDLRVELGNLLVKEKKESDAIAAYESAVLLRKCQVDLHLKIARLFEDAGNDERWLFHINEATKCSPGNANLNLALGRYYFNKTEYTKSIAYLQKALKVKSNLHEGCYLLGAALMAQQKNSQAQVYLQKAVKLNPESFEYRIAFAQLLYNIGKTKTALDVIRPVLSQPKMSPYAQRIAGLLYKTEGIVDTALQLLDDAISSDSKCVECHIAIGDIHYTNTEFSKAAKFYQKAIDVGGFEEYSAIRLADSYIKLKKHSQAQKYLNEILNVNPKNGEAIYRLSHLHIMNREFDSVEKLIGASTTPKNGWYYLTKGELDEVKGNINDAAVAFSKALKTLPNVSEVQAGCGRVNLAKKRYNYAITYFGQAMAGDPQNTQLYMDLGKAYEGSGDVLTALELYKEVETQMPDHPEVHFCMARVFNKQKDHEKSIDALKTGIARNRKNVLLYMALGHEYATIKKYDEAIETYLDAVKIDEKKAIDGYKYIGNIYSVTKNEKKAKKYYMMYINAGGQDKAVSQFLKSK